MKDEKKPIYMVSTFLLTRINYLLINRETWQTPSKASHKNEHHKLWDKLTLGVSWHELLRTQHHFCINHEKTSVKRRWRDIPQSNWPVLFKNFKVMQDKERINYSSGLKETKEAWQRNANHGPWMNSGFIKNTIGTTGEM